jgi:hypothetical protein
VSFCFLQSAGIRHVLLPDLAHLWGLGEEDVFGWFVHAGDVGHEPVADVRELVVGDELQDVLVSGVVAGLEHGGPELGGSHDGDTG